MKKINKLTRQEKRVTRPFKPPCEDEVSASEHTIFLSNGQNRKNAALQTKNVALAQFCSLVGTVSDRAVQNRMDINFGMLTTAQCP